MQVGHSHPSGPRFGRWQSQAQVSETLMKRLVYACEVLSPTISSRLIRRFNWSIAKLYRYAKRVEPERGRGWSLVL